MSELDPTSTLEVREIEFKDKSHAKLWIIDNQLNRRNLGIFVKAELALKKKELISKQAKQRQLRKPKDSVVQISAQQKGFKTRDELAKITISKLLFQLIGTRGV